MGYIPENISGWKEEMKRVSGFVGLLYFQKKGMELSQKVYSILKDMEDMYNPNSILNILRENVESRTMTQRL